MYPQSSLLTIGGTVMKESNDLVILGMVTFYSKMTFEKYLLELLKSIFSKTWYLKEVLASVPG